MRLLGHLSYATSFYWIFKVSPRIMGNSEVKIKCLCMSCTGKGYLQIKSLSCVSVCVCRSYLCSIVSGIFDILRKRSSTVLIVFRDPSQKQSEETWPSLLSHI